MPTNRLGQLRASSTIASGPSPIELEAVRQFVRTHEVQYELGLPECVDLGVSSRSIGFRIDVWTHTYAGDADEVSRAVRCRHLYDAVRHVVTSALASVEELRNAILWVEPWDRRVATSAARSLEVMIRIEIDELPSPDDGPNDTSAATLTRAVAAALERHGLGPRSVVTSG
jgi:hypothetical protein